jgi:DNA-directed RNA polymerase specialized sigma subunit
MPLQENAKECSIGFDYDALDPELGDEELTHSLSDVLEAMRKVVRYIRTKDRTRLTVDCLFIALGDEDVEHETMTTIAEKHGITKAAVSKRAKEIREQLHLSINANNKSAHVVQKYRNNRSPLRLTGPS